MTEGVFKEFIYVFAISRKTDSPCKRIAKKATKQENHLWYDYLKDYPIRFKRQKPISSFIADFYCHAARLVVELDGSQHYDEQGLIYDKERAAVLEQYGVKVLRFSNLDVERNFQGVCTAIDLAVKERIDPLSTDE